MYNKHYLTRLALVLFLVMPLPLLANNWEYLGERTVNYNAEKDSISVGAKDGTFRKIKLKVKKSPIHLIDLKIHYANGDVQDVAIRSLIKAGGETRTIDLAGNNRVIAKVTMRYRTLKVKKGKSKVRLFAKH